MSMTKLLRWSGLASILAGVLFALATVLHPPSEDVPAIITAAWVPAHDIGWVANLLLLLGLVGLYGRQAEKTGWLGLLGFVLAFIGVTLESGGNFSSVTLMPDLAATVPNALTTLMNRPPFAFPVAVVVFGLTLMASCTLGFLLFGFATLRANVLPRWAGLLLIIGVLLAFGSGVSPLIGLVAAVLFGLGLVWLDYALWSHKRAKQNFMNNLLLVFEKGLLLAASSDSEPNFMQRHSPPKTPIPRH